MAKIPEPQHTTIAAIYRHYEENQGDGHRPHLGISQIGAECERAIWYGWRWASKRQHSGRMLRLFESGHREELRVAENLKAIGVDLHTHQPDGSQWAVRDPDLGGHFGGSMDGAGKGFPEAPRSWAVWECKTSNTKAFKELQAKGLEKAKPQHWVQVNLYMGFTGMDRAMYMSVCKETDEIYAEWIHFDEATFKKYRERARRIITAAEPPLRISNDPSYFVCKFCDHHAVCHGVKAPLVNCRTCAHSTPEMDGDGRWSCAKFGEIGLLAQRESSVCGSHRYIPILLEKAGQQVDVQHEDVVYEANGQRWLQGAGGVSSVELSRMDDITMASAAADMKAQLAAQGIGSEVVS